MTLLLVLLGALLGACSGSDGSDDLCVQVSAECVPLYAPTFQNIFDNTLMPGCGVPGSACHAVEGAQGGLILSDIDTAYEALVTEGGRIDSDMLGCGTLLSRVATDTASLLMPPGAPLADSEICAITQWVAAGAPR
ncbi:MAG: hypothetical protein AAGC55_11200 [Myxococcota bacterium]